MLKQLRSRKVMRRVLQATLFLIIPSFVFFYGWSTISGERMFRGEYARVKKGTLSRWSAITPHEVMFATQLMAEDIGRLLGMSRRQISERAMDHLIPLKDRIIEAINNRLLLEHAEKHNLLATRQDLKGWIRAMFPEPVDVYLRYYLRQQRMSYNDFIERQRLIQTIEKGKGLVYSEAKASLFELWQQYLLYEENIKINYALIEVKDFLDKVTYNEAELNEFYQGHKEDYRLPKRINYDYILLTLQDLGTSATLTENAIEKYYDEHAEEFTTPRRVKLRHIQLNLPKEQTPEALKPVREKIEKIHQEAVSGQDFAELADKHSQDPRNIDESTEQKQGGILGYISNYSRPIWGDEFVQAALSLEEEQISSPVLSRYGFHILKAEEVIPEQLKPLGEVKENIISQIRHSKTQELLSQEVVRLNKEARQYTTLSALAQRLNTRVKETGQVDEGTYYFPEIGSLYKYTDTLDELVKGEMSEVLPLPDSLVIMQIKEKIPSHIPDLPEVREQVDANLTYKMAQEQAYLLAKNIKEKSKTAAEFAQVLNENELTSNTTEYFTRLELPDELRGYQKFGRVTLQTPQGAIILGQIEQIGGKAKAYIIWHMAEKKPPTRKDFINDLPQIQRELLQIKQQTLLREFLSDAREQIKIRINPELIR